MPPKLLACIRFLYKVVHKIGRLQKFNRAREIEFNLFTALTIDPYSVRTTCVGTALIIICWTCIPAVFLVQIIGLEHGAASSSSMRTVSFIVSQFYDVNEQWLS